jgi:exonuclease V gamma subunit
MVEPGYGLLEALIRLRVLNDGEVSRIRAVEPNVQEQNEQLLKYYRIKSNDNRQLFLEALKATNQQHVANWIEYNGRKCLSRTHSDLVIPTLATFVYIAPNCKRYLNEL